MFKGMLWQLKIKKTNTLFTIGASMRIQCIRTLILLILGGLLIAAVSSAASMDTVTISQTDSRGYTVDVTAHYDIEPHLLLSICYEPEHLRQYLPKKISVEVLQKDEKMHVLVYQGTFLLYTNRSMYQRRIVPEQQKIFFSLIEASQNIPLLPDLEKSDGFYEISQAENGTTLHYQQTTEVDREVSDKDLRKVKKQIRKYFASLRAYIHERTHKEQ